MRYPKAIIFLLITSIFGWACNVQPKTNDQETVESIPDKHSISDSDSDSDDMDDLIQEYGIIDHIEDGVYPMFVITVEFPERELRQDFDLNIESMALDHVSLINLQGQYATIHYQSELENMLLDIHDDATSILGEYAPKFDPEWKSITGTLQGATSETVSDLPDEITILDASGETMKFEYYITPEMVALNGQKVTAYYYVRGVHTIVDLVPSNN
ncbi:MAG: hypothetical protein KJP00_12475 [Bacteroidia bacterium]|nr:hypothetical protein [Bacteroidia bacterium]